MSGVCTSLILLAQYLMITFRRGTILFTPEAWWQIGGPGVLAMHHGAVAVLGSAYDR